MKIITVMSDEHSYQMMHFINHSILKTPNLDRLAANSIVFDSCYTPCPVCAPARASFISGHYVNRIGTWDNSTPYDGSVPGPVSYTHLDVYKRQVLYCDSIYQEKIVSYSRCKVYIRKFKFLLLTDIGILPVSYTHLLQNCLQNCPIS